MTIEASIPPLIRFALVALSAGCATQSLADSNDGRSGNWSTATALPEHAAQQRNILHVDGGRLTWNGKEVPETAVRAFLGVTAKDMNPQPVLILSYSAQTRNERVRHARLLVEDAIRCNPRKCLEVTSPTP